MVTMDWVLVLCERLGGRWVVQRVERVVGERINQRGRLFKSGAKKEKKKERENKKRKKRRKRSENCNVEISCQQERGRDTEEGIGKRGGTRRTLVK